MTKSIRAALRLGCCGMAAYTALTSPLMAQETPRLVLQITVDQLRGDMIGRFGAGLGPDGFNRLLDGGLHFAQAHHRHANTETIVGHATLATGADPAVHGMVANIWFDRVAGEQFYNVQDPDFSLVGAEGIDAETLVTWPCAFLSGPTPALTFDLFAANL